MRYPRIILAVLTAMCFVSSASAADKYKIDAVHSSIGFSVKHMLVTNVKGSFADFSGEIMLDTEDMTKSSVNVTIKTASISTNNERRDGHLKSADFFDVEGHADLTFRSSRIEKKGDGYVAYGALTMRGVTKEIELPFTLTGPIKIGDRSHLGVEGGLTINRQDYGVSYTGKILDIGGVAVGNEVKIELNIEAVSAASAE